MVPSTHRPPFSRRYSPWTPVPENIPNPPPRKSRSRPNELFLRLTPTLILKLLTLTRPVPRDPAGRSPSARLKLGRDLFSGCAWSVETDRNPRTGGSAKLPQH